MASERQRRAATPSAPQSDSGKRLSRKFFNVSTGFDMHFFVLLMIILIIGLATLYSASHVYAFHHNDGDSYFYILNQVKFAVIGFAVMWLVSAVDYHIWHKVAWLPWILSMIMLALALILPSKGEIKRWIHIGSFSFQPSEIAKFAVVLLLAHYISVNYKKMKTIGKGFLIPLLIVGSTCALVLPEPHLSGTLLIGCLGLGMMFVGGTRWGYIAGVILLGVAGVLFVVFVMGYEVDRMLVWFHPLESYNNEIQFPDGKAGRDHAWQTVQSLYTIGSGGLLGQGPGNSRQKHLFLPEPQNDFVFSVFCEEMGFVGAVLLLLLFAFLVWRGLKIALKAPDKFGCMLALGLCLQIGLQVGINVAVVSNLLPNTGISLPFFSYGGTSLVVLMMQMGVILSISRQSKLDKV